MSRAEWTLPAKVDLREIYLWIARHEFRREIARKNIRELRKQCDEYADAFAAGHVLGTSRADLGDAVRVFTYKRWVVVFRPLDDGITVLRVLDGSRDFTRIFSE
jgi:plasmid stabilization system protein ParE